MLKSEKKCSSCGVHLGDNNKAYPRIEKDPITDEELRKYYCEDCYFLTEDQK